MRNALAAKQQQRQSPGILERARDDPYAPFDKTQRPDEVRATPERSPGQDALNAVIFLANFLGPKVPARLPGVLPPAKTPTPSNSASSALPAWAETWGQKWPDRAAVFKAKDDALTALRQKYPGEWPSDFWSKAQREYPHLVARYDDASSAVSIMSRSELAEFMRHARDPSTANEVFNLPDTWQVPLEALKRIGIVVDASPAPTSGLANVLALPKK